MTAMRVAGSGQEKKLSLCPPSIIYPKHERHNLLIHAGNACKFYIFEFCRTHNGLGMATDRVRDVFVLIRSHPD